MRPRPHDVVVIGASAGGVEALTALLGNLPRDLPAAVAVTLHRSPVASFLAEVIGRRAVLPIVEAKDRMVFARGRIHLAPPDQHMRLERGLVRLDRGPRQHHTRPAIDPLFTSAAEQYGPRVVGIVLTGNMSDGVTGLVRIKEAGGLCLVQRPDDAPFPSMPRNALRFDHVDHVFDLASAHELLIPLLAGQPLTAASR
jgi:two-component system chemotaxis response regulator CheB